MLSAWLLGAWLAQSLLTVLWLRRTHERLEDLASAIRNLNAAQRATLDSLRWVAREVRAPPEWARPAGKRKAWPA